MTTLTRLEAVHTVRRYVCAGCYGPLQVIPAEDKTLDNVICLNCGDGRGFVTRKYAERRKAESGIEYMEARQVLRTIGAIAKRDVKQVLKELGI